jgi:hypothetical protein
MDEKKLKIITAAICGFNVSIDISGQMIPQISTDTCDEPCDYCRKAAEHILEMIENNEPPDI